MEKAVLSVNPRWAYRSSIHSYKTCHIWHVFISRHTKDVSLVRCYLYFQRAAVQQSNNILNRKWDLGNPFVAKDDISFPKLSLRSLWLRAELPWILHVLCSYIFLPEGSPDLKTTYCSSHRYKDSFLCSHDSRPKLKSKPHYFTVFFVSRPGIRPTCCLDPVLTLKMYMFKMF